MDIVIYDLPYLPINRARTVTRNMLIKTPLAREFEKDLKSRLKEYAPQFETFRKEFFSDKHLLEVTYNIQIPRSLLINKKGELSSRSPDIDSIKLLQDTIFEEIGIDDKYIKVLKVIHSPSHTDTYNYIIEVNYRGLFPLFV
jgi:hypothetical protein